MRAMIRHRAATSVRWHTMARRRSTKREPSKIASDRCISAGSHLDLIDATDFLHRLHAAHPALPGRKPGPPGDDTGYRGHARDLEKPSDEGGVSTGPVGHHRNGPWPQRRHAPQAGTGRHQHRRAGARDRDRFLHGRMLRPRARHLPANANCALKGALGAATKAYLTVLDQLTLADILPQTGTVPAEAIIHFHPRS